MSQFEQLWAQLLAADIVKNPAPELEQLESPWYVKILLGFSGWLAALFLLGFIGAGFRFIIESNTASFITGCAMIAGAFAILRIPKNEFIEHLALAVSLAGQALTVWAIFETTHNRDAIAWGLVAILEVFLLFVMPHFVHRVFSSCVAGLAFNMFLITAGAPYIFSSVILFIAAWLWLNEFHFPKQMSKIRAIAYGLILALLPIKGSALFGYTSMGWRSTNNQTESWVQPWMGEVLAAVVILYVIWELLKRNKQSLNGRLAISALLGALLLSVASMEAQGITVGMVIILLGFAGSNRVLLGLGIASLLFYTSSYYYLLDTTLLVKAQTLLIIGLVLFALRWIMLRIMSDAGDAQ